MYYWGDTTCKLVFNLLRTVLFREISLSATNYVTYFEQKQNKTKSFGLKKAKTLRKISAVLITLSSFVASLTFVINS